MTTARRHETPRQDALTKPRIVAAAIQILDAGGEGALTFRSLGAHLATGIGALQWHVGDKRTLMATIADDVVGRRLSEIPAIPEPAEAVRTAALAVFDLLLDHPWLGTQLANEPWQLAVMRMFEQIGRELTPLGVREAEQFDVASAVVNYLLGRAGQHAAAARLVPPGSDRTSFLASLRQQWLTLDAEQYPFVHAMADTLADHDDRQQFLHGLDMFLAGLAVHPRG